MICIIYKMLLLLKNHLNYPKDDIFELFLKNYNRLLFFLKKIRNMFRLKKLHCNQIWKNSDRNKTLSAEEYLNKISPYLKDITNCLEKSDKWNI